jgi:hypothetical protein
MQAGVDTEDNPQLLLKRVANMLKMTVSSKSILYGGYKPFDKSKNNLYISSLCKTRTSSDTEDVLNMTVKGAEGGGVEELLMRVNDAATRTKCKVKLRVGYTPTVPHDDVMNDMPTDKNPAGRSIALISRCDMPHMHEVLIDIKGDVGPKKYGSTLDNFNGVKFQPLNMIREHRVLVYMFIIVRDTAKPVGTSDSEFENLLTATDPLPRDGHTEALRELYFIFKGLNHTGCWDYFSRNSTFSDEFYDVMGPFVHKANSTQKNYVDLTFAEQLQYRSALHAFKRLIPDKTCYAFQVLSRLVKRIETGTPAAYVESFGGGHPKRTAKAKQAGGVALLDDNQDTLLVKRFMNIVPTQLMSETITYKANKRTQSVCISEISINRFLIVPKEYVRITVVQATNKNDSYIDEIVRRVETLASRTRCYVILEVRYNPDANMSEVIKFATKLGKKYIRTSLKSTIDNANLKMVTYDIAGVSNGVTASAVPLPRGFENFCPAKMSNKQKILVYTFSIKNLDPPSDSEIENLLTATDPPFLPRNGHTDDLMELYFIFTGLNHTGCWDYFSRNSTFSDEFYDVMGPFVHDAWILSRHVFYDEASKLKNRPTAGIEDKPYAELPYAAQAKYRKPLNAFKSLIPNRTCHAYTVLEDIVKSIDRSDPSTIRPYEESFGGRRGAKHRTPARKSNKKTKGSGHAVNRKL